ncbi:hypothetical protein J1N35_036918 [Gossypium stocksii]|uniref:Uncharacterized protein n=1 Tax=Gossypium stocksii TaxID=47602 RepID=A0A9D3UJS5_9ROSI|nr:hypothetical protein J1N35_036918 [Gossypium stocksii]
MQSKDEKKKKKKNKKEKSKDPPTGRLNNNKELVKCHVTENGKIASYIPAENNFQEIFSCLLKFCDAEVVRMRSKSDMNTFHVVAKFGNLGAYTVGVTFVIVEKHHGLFRRVGDDLALTVEI